MSKITQEPVLELFVVRSAGGQFYRASGRGGGQYKANWVSSLSEARIYSKPGPAKAQASWWLHNYPDYGVPEVVVLEARVAGTTKTKVSDKLHKQHAKLQRVITDLDQDIDELQLTIEASTSDIVRKSLGHQLDTLRAKRSTADKQAASLAHRVTRIDAATHAESLDEEEITGQ